MSTRRTFSNRKRILVVDDDSDIAYTFKKGLEIGCFDVEIFLNPVEALSHFKPNYFDLLLIDIRMPNMSGFELCRRIRKKDKNPKVCFTTSFPNYYQSLKENYPEINSACLISKPVAIENLINHINAELGLKF
jgi:DNA-binding response OmpR family regulator